VLFQVPENVWVSGVHRGGTYRSFNGTSRKTDEFIEDWEMDTIDLSQNLLRGILWRTARRLAPERG
jgi:hypothetical protein